MTDYQRDQAANEWAHRHRFSFYFFWPVVMVIVFWLSK